VPAAAVLDDRADLDPEDLRLPQAVQLTITARIARAWREGGAREVLWRAVERVRVDWLELGRELVPEELPPATDAHLSFAELSDAPELAGLLHLDPETARARLAAGHLCFATLLDGRPAAMVWARTDAMWLPFLRRHVPHEPGEVYVYDSYTDPAHRRLGLTSLRRAHMYATLYERGFRRARAYVLARNTAGLAAARAAGYQVIARHRTWALGRGHARELDPL
jgi:ribosomal protein S18 acetylase RimI-like enzyme